MSKEQTQMVAPPTGATSDEIKALRAELDKERAENSRLRMYAPPQAKAYVPAVKAKVLQPIVLQNGSAHKPGEEVLMSEDDAKEFCDKTITGVYDFTGERLGTVPLATIRRASRIA